MSRLIWEEGQTTITQEQIEVIDDTQIYESITSPVCSLCANLHSGILHTCAAFPDGIPTTIWNGKNKHRKPVAGDNGIIFTKGEV